MDWVWDPVTETVVVCNTVSVDPPIFKGKPKSCVGLPERQRLKYVQKRQNIPKKISCPRGYLSRETNIEADSVDIGHGLTSKPENLLGEGQR